MAQNVLTDLNFGQNKILNALMNPLASDPGSPVEGEVWFNTTTQTLRLRLSASTVSLAAGGGIANVVEDGTPQLGGMLDINGQSIGDGTRELITFVEDAAAVNQIEIENEATGGGPILRATGDDVNVPMEFQTKGSGSFNFTGSIAVTGNVDGRDIAADGADLDDLVTLSGVAANSTSLGTFTGTTITDTQTIKTALQELETALEAITGATNLGYTAAPTNGTVTSDTGTNATLTLADGTNAGLMAPADFTKLGGVATGADVTPLIDDDTMAAATAANVPSAESVVAYIATAVAGFSTYKGGYNASTNSPDLDTAPSGVNVGDQYTVTVAGTFFTTAVEVGDLLIAEINSASVEADWTIVNRNLDAASETVAGIAEIATQAETDAGTNDTTFVTPLKLATKPRGFAADCAATATTTVTHNLGTTDVIVQVFDTATGQNVIADCDRTGANAVDVTITPTPAAGAYRILVLDLI